MAELLHEIKIHSFMLMQNHFHLIVTTPQSNISEAMKRLLEMSSKRLTKSAGRINQTFGGRHFKSILQRDAYFQNCYKYVYYNPVKAGLVGRVESYPYSTLRWRLGHAKTEFPLAVDHSLEPGSVEETVAWLNRRPNEDHWNSVKVALTRNYFTPPKNGSGKMTLSLTDRI